MQNVPPPCRKEPSVPRIRQMKRTLHNFLLTTACGLMTILVLKGKIGFEGAPEQDLMQMRNQYEQLNLDRKQPAWVMTKENEPLSADADDGEDDQNLVQRKKVYSLGPKIFDWDQQRREWLWKNPSSRKPRILLVTGSQTFPCDTPMGDHYLLKSLKNKIDYCRLHNIELFYNTADLHSEHTGFWARLPIVRSLMLAHPEVEWFWWMDNDAIVTDMAFELPMERYRNYNFVLHAWNNLMQYTHKSLIELSTGSFLLRNCQWSLDFMEAWASVGFKVNDQSALIYPIVSQNAPAILVDQDEQMTGNRKQKVGDGQWPVVTGCKSCSKSSNNLADNSMEECFMFMETAFNFADNQVLKHYGFQHASLETSKVIKISHSKSS